LANGRILGGVDGSGVALSAEEAERLIHDDARAYARHNPRSDFARRLKTAIAAHRRADGSRASTKPRVIRRVRVQRMRVARRSRVQRTAAARSRPAGDPDPAPEASPDNRAEVRA
jgi:hypothetical protein